MPIQHITSLHTNRRLLAGAFLWALSIQYFIVQAVVALAYTPAYSLRFNTISDLGNTVCGPYRDTFVCSPHSLWMNLSFQVLGITMIIGSAYTWRASRKSGASTAGFMCMALSGIGSILVGLFPENTISTLHIVGAGFVFLFGNSALLFFGRALKMPRMLRYYTIFSGAVGLIALLLFVAHAYAGLGIGGMERITAYPQTLWLTVFGVYMAAKRSLRNNLQRK